MQFMRRHMHPPASATTTTTPYWDEMPHQLIYHAGTLSVAHQAWVVCEWPPGLVGDRLMRAMIPVRTKTWPLVQIIWRWQASSLLLNGSLERKIRRLELAVQDREKTELGPRRDEWTALTGLKMMRDALIFEGESLVEVDALITITSTPDLLADDALLLLARWEALGLNLRLLTYEQELAIRRSWGVGELPIMQAQKSGIKAWIRHAIGGHPTAPTWEPRIMTAYRAAGLIWPGWGFVSDDPERGVYVGHTDQGQPTFVDFFQDENGNAANLLAIGATGMGKSFWMKTLVRGLLAQGFGVVILDVDGEYAALCEAEQGTWIDVSGTQASTYPDPLAIPPAIGIPSQDAMRYDRMLNTVSQLTQILGEWDLVTTAAVQRAVMAAWHRYGVVSDDPTTWDRSSTDPAPTMEDVWHILQETDQPDAQNAARRLWVYLEGSQRYLFAGSAQRWDAMPTNLVVWHLGNLAMQGGLAQSGLPPETAGRYLLVLATTWEWLRQRRQMQTWTAIVADEGQRLLNQPILGAALADLASTIRKWHGILTFATNTPDGLWQTPAGQALWSTTPIKVFWRLEDAQAQAAAHALRMPTAIRQALVQLPEHQMVMRLWHDQWTTVRAIVPPTEVALYRTRQKAQ
jgi:hypothetical protein